MYRAKLSQPERRLLSESQLLAATCQVAVRDGLQGLTCEEVGRLAGYSRAQAYQRFGSKEGLLVAAVRYLRTDRRNYWENRMSGHLSGLEALIEHFSIHLRAISLRLETAAFFEMISHHAPDLIELRREVGIAKSELLDEIKLLISTGLQDGSIDPQHDCSEDSVLHLGLMLGVATEFLVARQDDELGRLRSRGEELVRRCFTGSETRQILVRH